MRREKRVREKTQNNNNILYIGGSILGIGIIAFVITFILYGNKMDEQSEISAGKIAALMQEAENDSKIASSRFRKNN